MRQLIELLSSMREFGDIRHDRANAPKRSFGRCGQPAQAREFRAKADVKYLNFSVDAFRLLQ
jgi:hypothetical protein